MQISITRALSELKLLSSRIDRAINESSFIIAYKKSSKKVNNIDTPDEFSNKAKADYQSINDLIERRRQIKSAIVGSNAKTNVTIAGKEMSVAEAIERKSSIVYEINLLASMEKQYTNVLVTAQRNNELVQGKLDDLLNNTLGKENRQKAIIDEVEAISKPYLEQNQYDVLDVLKLGDKIKTLKDNIDLFNMEVDFILSESNTLTKIEISDSK